MDNKEALVTVIIPAYNHENYVDSAISSIVSQTYRNIELIIIDDASSDNTRKKIELRIGDCQRRFSKFNFIMHDVNCGLTRTLNETMKCVSGEYICVMASDDVFEKTKIMKQVACFTAIGLAHDIGALITNGYSMDEKGQTNKNNPLVSKEIADAINTNSAFENYRMLFERGWYIPALSLMFKKSVMDIIGSYDESTTLEDFDIILRMFKMRYNLKLINEYLVYYRVHDKNYSRENRKIFSEKYLELILREKKYCKESRILNEWKDMIWRYIFCEGIISHLVFLKRANILPESIARYVGWSIRPILSKCKRAIQRVCLLKRTNSNSD